MTPEKRRVLDLAAAHVCPGRVRTFEALGIDLVIGQREGYRFRDLDGREFLDCHLNGGVFNLGHRHPELVAVLRDALDELDVGNHHFPSRARAELARALAASMPGDLPYVVFSPSGGEAIDVAIKTARHATRRRTVVSMRKGYHGHTGLALAAGDERFSAMFLSEGPPGAFVHVPFNDLSAMESALAGRDVAAVLLETIPATYGFPLPAPGYLAGVKRLCERYGTIYIADEVQTGLGRTGRLWAVECFDVEPDILVTGKGLSGGLYPMSATALSRRVAGWLDEDGWGHVSTFGGAELGCPVAMRVLEITQRPETRANVAWATAYLAEGLARLQRSVPAWLVEVRQQGLVIGLRFADERGGMAMSRACFEAGLWAMFAGFDMAVLQFKPGLLVDRSFCDEALGRLEDGVRRCLASCG